MCGLVVFMVLICLFCILLLFRLCLWFVIIG